MPMTLIFGKDETKEKKIGITGHLDVVGQSNEYRQKLII